jgi:hypothetical protein
MAEFSNLFFVENLRGNLISLMMFPGGRKLNSKDKNL